MTVEIISWSISTKVWDRTEIELATPGSAVRHASVARHVTDCATRPGLYACDVIVQYNTKFIYIVDACDVIVQYKIYLYSRRYKQYNISYE